MADEGSPMATPNAADSIVLEEEIDPNYVPSDTEILDYAKWMGMDLDNDRDLFWIAREGLMAPLPANWKPCKTKDTEDIYYFNFSTGESTWDHPCDGYYKRLYEEEKKKKEIRLKEKSDESRSKAKQDVAQIIGKKDKKKKPLESSLELKPADSPALRKPLPDLRKPPLSNSLLGSIESVERSSSPAVGMLSLSADSKSETGKGRLPDSLLPKASPLGSMSPQISPLGGAKGPQFSSDEDSKPGAFASGLTARDSSPAPGKDRMSQSNLNAAVEQKQEKAVEDKGLAPLTGRGLSPLRALSALSQSRAQDLAQPSYAQASHAQPQPHHQQAHHQQAQEIAESYIADVKESAREGSSLATLSNWQPSASTTNIDNSASVIASLEQQIQTLQHQVQLLQQQSQQMLMERSRLNETVAQKDVQITELRSESFRAESDMQTIKQERQLLQMEKSNLLAINQKLQATIESQNVTIAGLSVAGMATSPSIDTAKLMDKVQQLTAQEARALQQQRELEERVRRLERELGDAKLQLATQLGQLADTATQLQFKASEVQDLRSQLDKAAAGASSGLAGDGQVLNAELSRLEALLVARDSLVASLQAQDRDSAQRVAQLQGAMASKEEALAQLDHQLQAKALEGSELATRVAALQGEVRQLTENNQLLNQMLAKASASSDEGASAQHQALLKQFEDAQSGLARQGSLMEELRAQNADLQRERAKLVAVRAQLEQQLAEARTQRDQTVAAAATAVAVAAAGEEKDLTIRTLREQVDHMNTTIASMTAKIMQKNADSSFTKDNSSGSRSLEALEAQLADATTQLAIKERLESQSRTQLAALQAELAELQAKAQTWSSERQSLVQKLGDLQQVASGWETEKATLMWKLDEAGRKVRAGADSAVAVATPVDTSAEEVATLRQEVSALKSQLLVAKSEAEEQAYQRSTVQAAHATSRQLLVGKDREIEDLHAVVLAKSKEGSATAMALQEERFNQQLLRTQVDKLTASLQEALAAPVTPAFVAAVADPESARQLSVLTIQLQDAKAQAAALQQAAGDTEGRLCAIAEERSRLAAQLQERDSMLSSLRSELQEKTLAHSELTYSLSLNAGQVKQLKEMVAMKDSAIGDVHAQLHGKQKELLDLQIRFDETQHRLLLATASSSAAAAPIASGGASQEALEASLLASYKAQLTGLQQTTQELNARINALMTDKAQLAEKVLLLEQVKQRLQLALDAKSEELTELLQRGSGVDKKVRGYQEEILQLQRLLQAKAKEEHTKLAAVTASSPKSAELERRVEDIVASALSRVLQASSAAAVAPAGVEAVARAAESLQAVLDEDADLLEPAVVPAPAPKPPQVGFQLIGQVVGHFAKYTATFLSWAQSATADLQSLAGVYHSSSSSSRGAVAALAQTLAFRRDQESFFSKVHADFLAQCQGMIQTQRSAVKAVKASGSVQKQTLPQVNAAIGQLNDTIRAVKTLQQVADQRGGLVRRLQACQTALQAAAEGAAAQPAGGYYYQQGSETAKAVGGAVSACEQLLGALGGVTEALRQMASHEDDLTAESYFQEPATTAPAVGYAAYRDFVPTNLFPPPPPPPPTYAQPAYAQPSAPSSATLLEMRQQLGHRHQLGSKHQLDVVLRQIQDITARQDSSKQACDQYFRGLTSLTAELHDKRAQSSGAATEQTGKRRPSASQTYDWMVMSAPRDQPEAKTLFHL